MRNASTSDCAGEKVLDSIASPQIATRGNSFSCFLFVEQERKAAIEDRRTIKNKFFIFSVFVENQFDW
jgi:hypothetical protein